MTDPFDVSSDVHALSGAYAVDALDPDERVRFEDHLRGCPACRAEVDSLRETTAALASDAETGPPPALRDRVLAGIESVRPLPPATAPPRSREAQRNALRRRLFGGGAARLVLAAAVLAVIAVAGTLWLRPWSDDVPQPTAAERVLAAEDATRTTQRFPDGSSATVVVSRSEGRAVIVTEDMAPAPEGKVYEVWLASPQGDMLPAGLMPDDPDTTLVLEGDASEATAVGITVEPDGGSPEPTTEPIAVLELDA